MPSHLITVALPAGFNIRWHENWIHNSRNVLLCFALTPRRNAIRATVDGCSLLGFGLCGCSHFVRARIAYAISSTTAIIVYSLHHVGAPCTNARVLTSSSSTLLSVYRISPRYQGGDILM